ncbi:unc-49B protein [Aphelenchoides avenae]|nr:unc-49B protein [Aphelenchus avenae]
MYTGNRMYIYLICVTEFTLPLLKDLTYDTGYDKRIRPNFGGAPVEVGITMHVISVSDVSEEAMEFTTDLYLRQTWKDPRLAFEPQDIEGKQVQMLNAGGDYIEKIWRPDTFFSNAKDSQLHSAPVNNAFVRIESDGGVTMSQRLTVTSSCAMDLTFFPMDSHSCKLELESYGYTTEDIAYFWGKNRTDDLALKNAATINDFSLPQFRMTGYQVGSTDITTSSGNYLRLYVEVSLKRNVGAYIANIVMPTVLIVAISWIPFWLDADSSTARIELNVTAVFLMTVLISAVYGVVLKVSYLKALDVYLLVSFIMICASIVECAVVYYRNKHELQDRSMAPVVKQPGNPSELPLLPRYGARNSTTLCDLDRYSLTVFPLVYLAFNVLFWGVLLTLA